jgi:alkylhydroperoxidase/carboxymuconolactone decarboxylase family protein YurZ
MSPEELTQRLSGVQAKRGYLLPHHGLLAITSPTMMQAYDNLYTALALDHKTLSVRDRELVWLAILVACDEALATHHIARFYDGGGTDAEFKAVLRLTASLRGVTAYRFVHNHWMPHLPSIDIVAAYRDAVEHAGQPLSRRDIWLCACSVHAALGHFDWLHADDVPRQCALFCRGSAGLDGGDSGWPCQRLAGLCNLGEHAGAGWLR